MKCFAFRLDANAQIGTGHLMRCLAIANELDQNNSCHFLCKELPSLLHAQIVSNGHKVHTVNNENNVLAILDKLKPDYLIIDHYELDARFEIKVSDFCKHILVIDDMADRSHICNLLLDQGPLRTKDDYWPWINSECQLLLGTDYVLIKPEFRQLLKSHINSWRNGLISFGGSDPTNITLDILQALDSHLRMRDIKWTVIAGTVNPNWQSLKDFAAHSRMNITLIKHSDQIAALMASHDFAIGAAGCMAWERSCIGLPTLTIPIEDNQKFGIEAIKHFGLGETLQVTEMTSTMLAIKLKRLQHKANEYRLRNQAMVDGLGVERLLNTMLSVNT